MRLCLLGVKKKQVMSAHFKHTIDHIDLARENNIGVCSVACWVFMWSPLQCTVDFKCKQTQTDHAYQPSPLSSQILQTLNSPTSTSTRTPTCPESSTFNISMSTICCHFKFSVMPAVQPNTLYHGACCFPSLEYSRVCNAAYY